MLNGTELPFGAIVSVAGAGFNVVFGPVEKFWLPRLSGPHEEFVGFALLVLVVVASVPVTATACTCAGMVELLSVEFSAPPCCPSAYDESPGPVPCPTTE